MEENFCFQLYPIILNNTEEVQSRRFCFPEIILTWLPCAFLLITIPFYVRLTFKSKKKHSISHVYLSKMVLGVSLIVIQLVDFSYRLHELFDGIHGNTIHLLPPCVLIISEILATFLVIYDRRHGKRVNKISFIYRLILEITTCTEATVLLRCLLHPDVLVELHGPVHRCCHTCVTATLFTLIANTVLLILFGCFSEETAELSLTENVSPERSASLGSLLTFWWFTGFVCHAGKKCIDYDNLWALHGKNLSAEVSSKFDQAWHDCCLQRSKDAHNKNKGLTDFGEVGFSGSERRSLILTGAGNICDRTVSEKNFPPDAMEGKRATAHVGGCTAWNDRSSVNLANILFKVLGNSFLSGVFLNITHDILLFIPPFLFRKLIVYIYKEDAAVSEGIMYVVLLFSFSCLLTTVRHQYTYKYNIIGLRVHSALLSAVHKKCLLLRSTHDDDAVGEVTNLASVDVQKMVDMMSMVNYLWSCPIQLSLGIYFLWQLIGLSVMAGIAITLLMLPVNAWVAKKCKKFQVNQMRFKDSRMRMMNEIINGIKVLKLYAWEEIFGGRVSAVREEELRAIRGAAYLASVATFAWSSVPFLISLCTFGLYLLLSSENVLTPEKAFVSLTLFNILRTPLSILPMFISNLIVARVSLKRLEKFLTLDEILPQNSRCTSAAASPSTNSSRVIVEFKKACIGWKKKTGFDVILNSIDLEIPIGCLVAVTGRVGTGKSTLLSAIVGEALLFGGDRFVGGRIAYAGQQAWLQAASVKENILFGRNFDETKYKRVLDACDLVQDVQSLPAGDDSEVAERGVSLSGGQKQRISLARAIYSDADVFIFDDPFASVDVQVARHLFDAIFSASGLLHDKTRIVSTNSVSFLPNADLVVVLEGGKISEVTEFNLLLQNENKFNVLGQNFLSNEDDEDGLLANKDCESRRLLTSSHEQLTGDLSEEAVAMETRFDANILSLSRSSVNLNEQNMIGIVDSLMKSDSDDVGKKTTAGKLIEDEELKTERVGVKIFVAYLKAIGPSLSALSLVCFIANNLLLVSTNVWLGLWTDDAGNDNVTHPSNSSGVCTFGKVESQSYCRLAVYACLGFLYGLTLLSRSFVSALACSRASKVVYSALVGRLLSVPLSFYERTPRGRIINRISSDVATLDYIMPFTVSGFCNIAIMSLLAFITISVNIPIFVLPFVMLLLIYVPLQRFYVATARQLRRMSSIKRSHVFSHLSETLQGAPNIRAFKASSRFIDCMHRRIDNMQEANYLNHISQRWFGVWSEFLDGMLVAMVAMFAVLGKSHLSPGMVALSLTYAFEIIRNLNSLVSMFCELETSLVAVERIKEYLDLEFEENSSEGQIIPSDSWPHKGQVEFSNFSSRYRATGDLNLKKLSILIQPGEKVGIIGRTGSGKTSVLMSLFRVLSAIEGSIIIDGVDISYVPLKNLRSSMTLILQDPVIFSGSLRFNLDPTGISSDEELWNVLAESNLKEFVRELPGHLEYECGPGGNSLSLGQQQLLCLSRALLRRSKILVLDEATSSVDVVTEDIIKKVLERKFSRKLPVLDPDERESDLIATFQFAHDLNALDNNSDGEELHYPLAESCTLIVVAHRISTILDCDRIVVLDEGKIVELETPASLLKKPDSRFYKMCNDRV